ncbi:MAG: SGNH/GDSL hydrolase family protein [Myxococcota bacterium]
MVRHPGRRHFVALILVAALGEGCDAPPAPPAARPEAPRSPPLSRASSTATPTATPPPITTASAAPPEVPPVAACTAPSRSASGLLDVRDDAALKRCGDPAVGARRPARPCGAGDPTSIPRKRLEAAVPALDPKTRAHVARIVAEGRAQGRRADVFGVVGDSMSISGAYLSALAREETTTLAPELEATFTVGDVSMLARFRGVAAITRRGVAQDSFVAWRAARSGARVPWALRGGRDAPLRRMVRWLSPAVAFVLFGGNDAAFYATDTETLVARFKEDLGHVVDALETAGVVPVLHTLARHGDAPGVPQCGIGEDGRPSDWRLMVRTNALSVAVVELACTRALPLIDLRDAFDTADAAGLSSDATHPSVHRDGSGRLDAAGLRCGQNLRNYLTLRMLARLWPLL